MQTWTLFGAGNFTIEIIEAIEANDDTIASVVLNQEVDTIVRMSLEKRGCKFISINEFDPNADRYFFGFVNSEKASFIDSLSRFNLQFSNLIHPFSFVSPSAVFGQGNFIGAGSIVGAEAEFGDFNIINRHASVGHHVRVGNFNHIAPGVTISGRCMIKDRNFFGSGSVLIDGISVADDVILGAGGVAVKSIMESGTYVGVPAKKYERIE